MSGIRSVWCQKVRYEVQRPCRVKGSVEPVLKWKSTFKTAESQDQAGLGAAVEKITKHLSERSNVRNVKVDELQEKVDYLVMF